MFIKFLFSEIEAFLMLIYYQDMPELIEKKIQNENEICLIMCLREKMNYYTSKFNLIDFFVGKGLNNENFF